MNDEQLGQRMKDAFHRKPMNMKAMDAFNEADHPRAENGQFGEGGGTRKNKEKYYVNLQQKTAWSEKEGVPKDLTGFKVVELPETHRNSKYLKIKGKGDKEFPAMKVAMAIAAGQIKPEDIVN